MTGLLLGVKIMGKIIPHCSELVYGDFHTLHYELYYTRGQSVQITFLVCEQVPSKSCGGCS
ncbi:MAG: hypothetical protein WCF90_05375 [Methanomicrobiales archaeon]